MLPRKEVVVTRKETLLKKVKQREAKPEQKKNLKKAETNKQIS